MRRQTDVSLTQAARRGLAADSHTVVGYIQNAVLIGNPEGDRRTVSVRVLHHIGQQLTHHPEHDGVDRTVDRVLDVGGDLDTRTLRGKRGQLFNRSTQPDLLKNSRVQLEGRLPQSLRGSLKTGQRAPDTLI